LSVATARSFRSMSTATNGRVVSPDNILEASAVFEASPLKPPLSQHSNGYNPYVGEPEQRVTIWNKREQRKLSGNSAPFRKNLQEYIRKHPDWEVYCGQDKDDYVPGWLPSPPTQLHSSQPSSEVRRERESRRVMAQQRERLQRRETLQNSATAKSDDIIDEQQTPISEPHHVGEMMKEGSSSRETSKAVPPPHFEEQCRTSMPTTFAYYRNAPGRESEPPLRLVDTTFPRVLPSAVDSMQTRAEDQQARRVKLGIVSSDEKPSNKIGLEITEQDYKCVVQKWSDEEWKEAQEQILKEKSERMGKVLTARNQVFKRIRAEHENMQLSAIQASTVRIQYFKSRKLDA